jgi:sugar lactone lactonase YvrE
MLYGTGSYKYELVDGWAKWPQGWSFPEVRFGKTGVGSISIDSQDRVYVLSRSLHPVVVFDREGNLVTSWGEGFFSTRAHGSCVGPDGFVYCTDDGNHTVSKFTPEGRPLLTLGNKNQPSDTGYVRRSNVLLENLATIRGGPPFNRPTDVALSSSGEIYVTDGYGNARVHKFTPDGTLLFSWGEPGYEPGQFRLPHSVCVDKQERVWVTDRENNRIQIFSAQGKFLHQWNGLCRPSDISIDSEDIVYVSQLDPRRCVGIFGIDGKPLAQWGSEGQDHETALFSMPHAIAVDSQGDLYVGDVFTPGLDRAARVVQKFARRR